MRATAEGPGAACLPAPTPVPVETRSKYDVWANAPRLPCVRGFVDVDSEGPSTSTQHATRLVGEERHYRGPVPAYPDHDVMVSAIPDPVGMKGCGQTPPAGDEHRCDSPAKQRAQHTVAQNAAHRTDNVY